MIGVVDLGTNTFNLLISERSETGMRVVYTEDHGVKLGKGGIEKGAIAPDAYQRGIETLVAFSETAREHQVSTFIGLGTSMLRNASNGKDFIREAKERAGIDIQIIKGAEEAAYIIDGVRQAVEFGKKPSLVIDIGGGSVEFILASKEAILWKHSFEVGTTRLLERIGLSDPLSASEHLRMEQYLSAQLGVLWGVIEKHHPNVLVGSAGSFDSLAEMISKKRGSALGKEEVCLTFSPSDFHSIADELMVMPRAERLCYPGLPEYRVDTMIPSLVIIDAILQRGISTIHWSKFSMKEGAAWRLLG